MRGVALLIREVQLIALRGLLGIGVEVVVNVEAIHRIALQHIAKDSQRVLRRAGLARVYPQLLAIALDPARLRTRQMLRAFGALRIELARAVGIEPSVEFDSRAMRLFDPVRQRVVAWAFALGTAEVLAPGFEPAVIERVGTGAHLQDEGVQAQLACPCHRGAHLSLLLGVCQALAAGPIDIGHRGHPGGPELARDDGG